MNTNGGSPRSRSSLPSAQQMMETIDDLEQLWQKVVPRSARPVNKGLYERTRRQLARVLHYIEVHGPQLAVEAATSLSGGAPQPHVGGADVDGAADDGTDGDDDEESPLLLVFRIVRTLSPEQWEQVQLLMKMREFSDVGRAEVFYVLGETHHTDCGMELDADDPHDDCPAIEEPPLQMNDDVHANGEVAAPAEPVIAPPLSLAPPEPLP